MSRIVAGASRLVDRWVGVAGRSIIGVVGGGADPLVGRVGFVVVPPPAAAA
jgi:hypothetical protein